MSTVCPACGVAVVPGYVRCPKCHAGLPAGRSKRVTAEPSGTSLARPAFPTKQVALAVGGVAVIVVVIALLSGGNKHTAAAVAPPEPIPAEAVPQVRRPVTPPASAPTAEPAQPTPVSPVDAMRELENALHLQRLWGRAEVAGSRINLRSGSCADPGMKPLIESRRTELHSAGLTRLRCVEQSGAVVFELDL